MRECQFTELELLCLIASSYKTGRILMGTDTDMVAITLYFSDKFFKKNTVMWKKEYTPFNSMIFVVFCYMDECLQRALENCMRQWVSCDWRSRSNKKLEVKHIEVSCEFVDNFYKLPQLCCEVC